MTLVTAGNKHVFKDFQKSSKPNFRELYNRISETSDSITRSQLFLSDRRYATYASVVFDSHVTNTEQLFQLDAKNEFPFQCMRSCPFSYYGVLGLRRHSPYMEVVNDIIFRLRFLNQSYSKNIPT